MTVQVAADLRADYAAEFGIEFCDARQSDEHGALVCDYLRGHGGDRHAERWVASWRRDGSDVRWYVGDSLLTRRPVYRTDAAAKHPGDLP